MRYTVLWTPTAEQELAAIWTASADRSAVTAASKEIDRTLSVDPELKGEVSFDTVRTLVVDPLGVDFEVVEADRIVYVLAVWDITTSPPG
jgi:hypothetical protein